MPSSNPQVNFRLSPEERAAVEAAMPEGMTVGAYARRCTLTLAGFEQAAKAPRPVKRPKLESAHEARKAKACPSCGSLNPRLHQRGCTKS